MVESRAQARSLEQVKFLSRQGLATHRESTLGLTAVTLAAKRREERPLGRNASEAGSAS
jgi:hypothetical protein